MVNQSLNPQVILPNINTCSYGIFNFRTVLKYGKLIIAPFTFTCETSATSGVLGLNSYIPEPFNTENTLTTVASNGAITTGIFSIQKSGMIAFNPNGTNHNGRVFNGTIIYISNE